MAIPKERRQYRRLPWSITVQFRSVGDLTGIWQEGVLVDVGAGGLRIVSRERCEKGERLELRFALPMERSSSALEAKVIWVKAREAEQYAIGTEFINVTPEQRLRIDELVRFLGAKSG